MTSLCRKRSGCLAATFQEKSIDPKGKYAESDARFSRFKECLCGQEDQFQECPYLIESLRPKDWTPDPDIQKQIEEKISTNPKLKTKVEYARKDAAKKKQEDKEKEKEKDS